jgi:hypothetical protein
LDGLFFVGFGVASLSAFILIVQQMLLPYWRRLTKRPLQSVGHASPTTFSFDFPYVFWIFNWGIVPLASVGGLKPNYWPCFLQQDEIRIYLSKEPLILPYSQIRELSPHRFNYGSTSAHTTRIAFHSPLTFAGWQSVEELYIAFCSPMSIEESEGEARDFVHAVEQIKSNKPPQISPSAPDRELIRTNQADQIPHQSFTRYTSPREIYPPSNFIRDMAMVWLIGIFFFLPILLGFVWFLGQLGILDVVW